MALRPLLFALFFLLLCPAAQGAQPRWQGPWKNVAELVPLLESVPEGKKVLEEAAGKDKDFLAKIKTGDASFTESTFARTYSLLDGRENIELRHEVTINRRLSLADAVIDLAHELVHFTEKRMLDPYKPGFELRQFVQRGIEGQGGELAALERECVVAWAMKERFPGFPRHQLCESYRAGARFNRAKALADYYALGSWFRKNESLKEALPLVSDRTVVFTSSYARKPYPVALAEEFSATREAACANNRKKYRLISAQAEGGRAPSSDQLLRERRRLKAYDRLYCAHVGNP